MQAAMNFDLLREDFSFFQTYNGDDDVEWVCEKLTMKFFSSDD